MTELPENLTEMERLLWEFSKQTTEDEAIDLFYRMQWMLYELIRSDKPAPDGSDAEHEYHMSLIDGMGDFYIAFCRVSDAGFVRARKVWWCLMEGLLHLLADDFSPFWHAADHAGVLFLESTNCFDVDQRMRMFFDEHLGPLLLDCFFEEGDEEERKCLQDAAEHYLQTQNMEMFKTMLPDWLDEEEA